MVNNKCSFGEKRSQFVTARCAKPKDIQKRSIENNLKQPQNLDFLQDKKFQEKLVGFWFKSGRRGKESKSGDMTGLYKRQNPNLHDHLFIHTGELMLCLL